MNKISIVILMILAVSLSSCTSLKFEMRLPPDVPPVPTTAQPKPPKIITLEKEIQQSFLISKEIKKFPLPNLTRKFKLAIGNVITYGDASGGERFSQLLFEKLLSRRTKLMNLTNVSGIDVTFTRSYNERRGVKETLKYKGSLPDMLPVAKVADAEFLLKTKITISTGKKNYRQFFYIPAGEVNRYKTKQQNFSNLLDNHIKDISNLRNEYESEYNEKHKKYREELDSSFWEKVKLWFAGTVSKTSEEEAEGRLNKFQKTIRESVQKAEDLAEGTKSVITISKGYSINPDTVVSDFSIQGEAALSTYHMFNTEVQAHASAFAGRSAALSPLKAWGKEINREVNVKSESTLNYTVSLRAELVFLDSGVLMWIYETHRQDSSLYNAINGVTDDLVGRLIK